MSTVLCILYCSVRSLDFNNLRVKGMHLTSPHDYDSRVRSDDARQLRARHLPAAAVACAGRVRVERVRRLPSSRAQFERDAREARRRR